LNGHRNGADQEAECLVKVNFEDVRVMIRTLVVHFTSTRWLSLVAQWLNNPPSQQYPRMVNRGKQVEFRWLRALELEGERLALHFLVIGLRFLFSM